MLAAAVLIAGPALAAVQNVKVSGSVDSTYLYRRNFDFGTNSAATQLQSTFLTQSTLQVDADLTDQVGATIALINERTWEADAGDDLTGIDLQLAYVKLREMLYSPLTLIIGRQNFAYGNSLIIDSAGTNNSSPGDSGINGIANDLTKQTALDAFRAILDYNPLTIDIVYAQIAETAGGGFYFSGEEDDHRLAGVNANYQLGDDMDSVIEAYFWKRHLKEPSCCSGNLKSDTTYTFGGRVSTNPIEGLNLQVENAYQSGTFNGFGSTNHARRSAWIVQAIANYQIPALDEYNPTIQYVYTKATGNADDNSDPNRYTAWDPMFENQGGGKIYNSIFNLSNMHIHQLTLGFNPMEDLLAKVSIAGLWLERKFKSPFAASFYPLTHPGSGGDSFDGDVDVTHTRLGKELDLDLIYDYTEDVQIGGNLGWFFPGGFFPSQSSETAKQAILHMNVAF